MKSERVKAPRAKATQVYVKSPKLRPKITYPVVTVPEQKLELVQVVVKVTKENMNANPKNKGTQVKGRSVKS